MKCTGVLFCLIAGTTVARSMSISGSAIFNTTGVSAGGSFLFPRIPGINIPLNLFGFSTSSSSTSNITNNNNNTNTIRSGELIRSVQSSFDIPDVQSLIPDFSSFVNTPNAQISPISPLTDLSQLSSIPGLSVAMSEARNRVTEVLQLGSNFTAGIEQAIREAFESNDPTAALRTIVHTILNAYLTVASNCPVMVIRGRVIQEGIKLALEVARSARNVIIGTTSVPMIN